MSDIHNNNQLFITAVKDGKYVSVSDFKPKDGNKCGCTCPECGKPVRSNISSKDPWELKRKFTSHFSHIDENTTCKGGYRETQLHLLAKSIIENATSLNVPRSPFQLTDKIEYTHVAVEPAFPFEEYKQYRPDIILTAANEDKIAIEIFVTNDLSFAKTQLYREAKLKCLKIDLSEFTELDPNAFRAEIETEILREIERKKWISPAVIVNNRPDANNQKDTSGCMLLIPFIIATVAVILSLVFYW